MMHVSPCAWYCFFFEDKGEWDIRDLKDKTIISNLDGTCTIELVAARKIQKAIDVEISDYHETYLRDEQVIPLKTVMTENAANIVTIVTRGTGPDERFWIVCHAFWNNYCAFIRYHGHQREAMQKKIQVFYDIVQSLQPLAMD